MLYLKGVVFKYDSSRSGEVAKKFYEGFKGTLITDAYAGYEKVEGIKRALCWSHLRRYYVESIPLDSKGNEIAGSKGAEGREFCDRLFEIERQISELKPQEKKVKRHELSIPILKEFWAWVEETKEMYTMNENLKKALTYTTNQKKYLETFLEDGRTPISNNDCEGSIRPFAYGRRAWLFADSQDGATANGVIYTIVETAKLNGLNVYEYIKYLLEVMPDSEYQINPEILDEYMPWSMTLPAICRSEDNQEKDIQVAL